MHSIVEIVSKAASKHAPSFGAFRSRFSWLAAVSVLGVVLCIGLSGCETSKPAPIVETTAISTNAGSLFLHAGDALQIRFPSTPEMDCAPVVGSDGKISIPMLSDPVKVSGLTREQAHQVVLDAAGPLLKVKDVTLEVRSSAFIIYVFGSVMRPGEIMSDRTLTPFEAVIKAGIDNQKSNLAKVRIIRIDDSGRTTQKTLNLKAIITKGASQSFVLKPFDKIYVPEKFSAF